MSMPTLNSDSILADLNGAAERIWLAAHQEYPDLNLEVVPDIASTNTALMAQGRRGHTQTTLLVAAQQHAGRGRQDRRWQAQAGQTLTFSLGMLLPLNQVPGGPSALSLAVGLSLAQSVEQGWQGDRQDTPPHIQLKWPNDLWIDGHKLGGILIETCPAPGATMGMRWVVIGVGLNVTHSPPLPQCTALASYGTSSPLSVGQVWSWLAPPLLKDIDRFVQHGFQPLQAAFAQRDALQGQTVHLWHTPGHHPSQTQAPNETAYAIGIDAHGALLVHTEQGTKTWHSGEVSVRPQSA